MFVATKKQAKQVVAEKAAAVNMPYVIERWPGGMLTNFPTIRKAVKKMANIDKLTADGTYSNLSKREILSDLPPTCQVGEELGFYCRFDSSSVCTFVVDVLKEQIAVREANSFGYPCVCYRRYELKSLITSISLFRQTMMQTRVLR